MEFIVKAVTLKPLYDHMLKSIVKNYCIKSHLKMYFM